MKNTAKLLFMALFAFTLFAAGCATAPKPKEETVFFPPPPQPPRYQFLVSFKGAEDIEGERSGFDVFITGEKGGRRKLSKPYGIAMHEGKIYVCDTGGAVIVFDLEKKTYGQLKGAEGSGKLVQPINISIDREGNKYVTDTLRKVVVVFNRNDEYVKTLGIKEKWKPVDAARYEDRIYVTDLDNSEIKVFDLQSGKLVKKFGSDSLDWPMNLAFDKQGYLFVSDVGRFQVLKFDRDGHLLQVVGKLGLNYGHFQRPKGVAVDRSGRLYVVDSSFYNVQVFRENGQLLTFFGGGGASFGGGAGKPGNLVLPASVSINYDDKKYFEQYLSPNFEMEYLVLVTSQFGDRMVNVYAFGKEKGVQYPTDEQLDEELKQLLLKGAGEPFKQNIAPEKATDEGLAPKR